MTILSVDFIPRRKAEALAGDEATALISITEPESGFAQLAAFPEILRLAFHDVDSREETEGLQQVWGIANPPSAHHVTNWDHLEG